MKKYFLHPILLNTYGVVMILLGIVIRFIGISRDSLSFDEVATYIISLSPLSQVTSMKYFDLANPPYYYFIMHIYIRCMEIWTPITELVLRFPSYIFSCIALILFSIVARRAFPRSTGYIVALLLYTVSIPLIHFSQIARAYAFQQMLSILLLYFAFLFLNQPFSRILLLGIVLTSTLLLYTHYSSALLLICFFISLLHILWRKTGDMRIIIRVAISIGMILFLCLPLLRNQLYPVLFSHRAFDPKTAWGYSVPTARSIMDFLMSAAASSLPSSLHVLFWAILLIFFAYYFLRIYTHRDKRISPDRFMVFVGIVLITEWLLMMIPYTRNYFFNTYYYLYVSAPLFIWLGYLSGKSKLFSFVIAIFLLGVIIPSLSQFYKHPHEIQFREATTSLRELGATKESKIVLRPCMISVPLTRYYATEYHMECFNDIIPHEYPEIFVIIMIENQTYTQQSDALGNQMKQFGYSLEGVRKYDGIEVLKFNKRTNNE